MSTLTQISNLFNLMVQQPNSGLKFYHFGWRSDINRNIDNNFDQGNETGRLYPALQFHVPEYTELKDGEKLQFEGYGEKIQITLWFDDLQDYENDGSQNTDNLIEQWQKLKKIADVFVINFNELFSNHYQAGYLSDNIKFIPRSNLHNDRLITWEVNFELVHVADCVDILDQIDVSQFPATFEDVSIVDLENYDASTPPTRCDLILQQLSTDDLLNCILPTYDFSTTEVQDATTAQQQTDMQNWLCVPCPPCPPSGINSSMYLDGAGESMYGLSNSANDFERTDAFTVSSWVKLDGVSNFPIFSKWFGQRGYLFRIFDNGAVNILMGTGAITAGRRISISTSVGVFDPTIFNHFMITYDGSLFGSGINIYINAVNIPFTIFVDGLTQNFTMKNPTINMEMGSASHISTYGAGWYYDSKTWSSEFSSSDVLSQHNADLADIQAGKPIETIINPASKIDWNQCGQEAGFGRDSEWCLSNAASTTMAGYDTMNMEKDSRDEVNIPT